MPLIPAICREISRGEIPQWTGGMISNLTNMLTNTIVLVIVPPGGVGKGLRTPGYNGKPCASPCPTIPHSRGPVSLPGVLLMTCHLITATGRIGVAVIE